MKIKTNNEKSAIMLLALSIGFISIVAVTAVVLNMNRPDRLTHCISPASDFSQVDFIIDTTDPISDYQAQFLFKSIKSIVESKDIGTKIGVYSISSKIGGLSAELFGRCKPKSGSDANIFYENKIMVESAYNKGFFDIIRDTISEEVEANEQQRSPIVEAFLDYSKLEHGVSKSRELFVFTDLLQNTKDYSVYKTAAPLKDYPYSPSFDGTAVKVFLLERKGTLRDRQSTTIVTEWANLIGATAESLEFEKVRY
jgi:hypothetical protein